MEGDTKISKVEITPLDTLPDLVLRRIYLKSPPGVPENLRITCKRLNNAYLATEGMQDLAIPRSFPKVKLQLDTTLRADLVSGDQEFHSSTSVKFQRLMRFMRLTKDMTITFISGEVPSYFRSGNHKYNMLKQFLSTTENQSVHICAYDFPENLNDIFNLLPDSTHITFSTNTFDDVVRHMDIVPKITEISTRTSNPEPLPIIHQVLEKAKALEEVDVHSRVNMKGELTKYMREWEAGQRNIKHWYFRFASDLEIRSSYKHFTRTINGKEEHLILMTYGLGSFTVILAILSKL